MGLVRSMRNHTSVLPCDALLAAHCQVLLSRRIDKSQDKGEVLAADSAAAKRKGRNSTLRWGDPGMINDVTRQLAESFWRLQNDRKEVAESSRKASICPAEDTVEEAAAPALSPESPTTTSSSHGTAPQSLSTLQVPSIVDESDSTPSDVTTPPTKRPTKPRQKKKKLRNSVSKRQAYSCCEAVVEYLLGIANAGELPHWEGLRDDIEKIVSGFFRDE